MADPQPVLKGRVALVTGASRGIGRAIAQRLAAAGVTVTGGNAVYASIEPDNVYSAASRV